jgi:pyruvate dehydrogenase E2 component (dihydrolipoamide acetyltransferase)
MASIIDMPKLSDTMTTGTVAKWLVKVGDTVEPGQMIAEVETDKATMELENFEEGVILALYVPNGGSVPVGSPVCAVGEKGEKAPEVAAAVSEAISPESDVQSEEPACVPDPSTAPEQAVVPVEADSSVAVEQTAEGNRIKVSPIARKIAQEKGLSLSHIKGTGPGGRIIRDDVLNAKPIAASAPATAPSAIISQASSKPTISATPIAVLEDKVIKVSNMRGTIARRLLESKTTIPHFYLEMEVDVAPLLALRQSINDGLSKLSPEQGGIKLTVNDFILKATTEALRRVPAANASWKGDSIIQHGNVHLAFAVSVEEGLLTPTLRNTEAKSIRQIALEAKELIAKARSKKLKPEEMAGSTFTITNLGMYGIKNFYGIINPPNGAILSIGATEKKPVVNDQDQIVVGYRMSLGLSGDHRVVDGAVAAEFLVALKSIIESPAIMLV